MIKLGTVVAVDGGMATVEYYSKSKCDVCTKRTKVGACEVCPDHADEAPEKIVAYNKLGAEAGDRVEYGRAYGENVIFVLLVFAVPIIAAVLAYFVAVLFTDEVGTRSRVALVAFCIATAIACAYSYKNSKKRCDYSISRIVESEE